MPAAAAAAVAAASAAAAEVESGAVVGEKAGSEEDGSEEAEFEEAGGVVAIDRGMSLASKVPESPLSGLSAPPLSLRPRPPQKSRASQSLPQLP